MVPFPVRGGRLVRIVFWDIDGTLLVTQRAGLVALDDACRELLDLESIDWSRVDTRGFTDYNIVRRLLQAYDKPCDAAAMAQILAAYEARLPTYLARRPPDPLPGVVAILERLKSRSDVLSVLLTGNTRGGARAKLSHYGLLEYFRGPNGGEPPFGAFAEHGEKREAIAQAALALAEGVVGQPIPGDRCFVIGDTPHDVSCGKAIGARTVAVATGGYTLDDLRACEPWRLWTAVPAPDEFERMLGSP
jgi:phosphoglycolate phosphatase-like HAD superfamily hydrolase